jgi:hypothetical protein
MDTLTRRSALAAGAAFALVACSEPEPGEVREAGEEPSNSPEDAAKIAAWEARVAALEEESRAVAAWVEQHRGALPTDYDELARLPSAYRLAVFLALPPEHASALIQEHLRRSVVARPEMTAAQREVISQAQALFLPAWYAGQHEMRVAVWQGPFGQRVDQVFSREERIRLFGTIGPEDDGIRAKIADALGR